MPPLKVAVLVARTLRGSGFATRINSMLESYVDGGHEVDVFHYRFPHEVELPARIAASVHSYIRVPLGGGRFHQHAALLPPLAWHCHRAHLNSVKGIMRYDVVQAETSNTWAVARTFPARRRLLVLHDDDSRRLEGLAKTTPDLVHRMAARLTGLKYSRWQQISIREADRVWFVSSVERDRLASGLTARKALLVPNGAGDELWSVPLPTEIEGKEILFIAPGFYEANAFGLAWFLRDVWPLVTNHVSGAHLRVVGLGWEGFGSHPDVSFVGWRDSLVSEYSKGRLAVAPLFAGGGTKLKVVEAMAAGRPVVASSAGAEGITPSDGLRVRDDPQGFAAEVGRFLTDVDLARRAGGSNRSAVDGLRWSTVWDSAARDLQLLMQ